MAEYLEQNPQILLLGETTKNKYGQYFTPEIVAEFMVSLSDKNLNDKILEPSCGEGVFLDVLADRGFKNVIGYEIDKELSKEFTNVIYKSFVTEDFKEKFDLIIGNPPYIRWKNLEEELKQELSDNRLWKKYFNSLCDYLYIFILKSIELLNDEGELIFICPEYWMSTTHSLSLRNYMAENGYFESIFHFNETPIFNNATVSTVVFKYIKSQQKKPNIKIAKYYKNKKLTKKILDDLLKGNKANEDIDSFSVPPFQKNERWLLTKKNEIEEIVKFENACKKTLTSDLFGFSNTYNTISEICDIGNGMVSGLDKTFQLNGQQLSPIERNNTIKVIKAKDLEPYTYNHITKYIFLNNVKDEDELKTNYPIFYKKLSESKDDLEKRYQYNRNINYWEWVFLRNYNLFRSEKQRIFVPCKERISNKDYFRFSLVEPDIFPTQDVTAIFMKDGVLEDIYYVLAFLNNHRVFNWLKSKGIVKGNIVEFSERPISSIPFRKIDFSDENEVSIYEEISRLTKYYIENREEIILDRINDLFDKIL